MKLKLVLLTFMALWMGQYSYAQISDILSKKLEQQLNKKLEKEMEEEMEQMAGDDSEDAVLSDSYTAMFAQVEIADVYSFKNKFTYHVTVEDNKKKKTEMDMVIAPSLNIDDDYSYIKAISSNNKKEAENVILIMDNARSAMITVMIDQKMYMTISSKSEVLEDAEDTEGTEDYTLVKTGNTKVIMGYKCEEFSVKTEDSTGNIWVTNDPELGKMGWFGFSNANNNMFSKSGIGIDGVLLEMNMVMNSDNKNGDVETMSYVITDIDKSKFDINMSEYRSVFNPKN